MAEQHLCDGTQVQGGTALKRRDILAAAGVVIAGIVAKQTSQAVAAITGGTTGGALIIGANAAPGNAPNTSSIRGLKLA